MSKRCISLGRVVFTNEARSYYMGHRGFVTCVFLHLLRNHASLRYHAMGLDEQGVKAVRANVKLADRRVSSRGCFTSNGHKQPFYCLTSWAGGRPKTLVALSAEEDEYIRALCRYRVPKDTVIEVF